jgi:predicted nuclease of restriction endonuclease-like RecB superfamily
MVLTLIIVSVLIAFMGWDIRSQIVSEVTRDVSTDIENFSVQIDSSLKLINAKTASFLRETEQFQKTLSERYTNIETLLGIYVVPDIKIMGDNQRLYFKDLHPINAEKLPIFRKPPIVDVQQSGLVRDVLIIQHTKDYIELSLSSVGENVTSEKPLFVTLWIVERE